MFKKTITQLFILIIVLSCIFIANGLILAWTPPGDSPPDPNVDAPINVGSTSQYKEGALGIEGIFRGYSNAIFDGNVGIGTTNLVAKLDVNGNIKIGLSSSACDNVHAGEIRWTGLDFEGCNGTEWLSLVSTGTDGDCPNGYEPFTNQLGDICIPIDDWELSSSATGISPYFSNYSITAESRINNGVRQVRITECSGYGTPCTTDWSNDVAYCKRGVYDVWQPGCLAITTSRYIVKAVNGNLYGDVPISPVAETIFGPGLQLAVPVPEGVGIDVPKGEHKGGCVLQNRTSCIEEKWPGSCASDNKSCICADGYRVLYRWDLFQRDGYEGESGIGRRYHYDCIKN